jgi:hypothetical protein
MDERGQAPSGQNRAKRVHRLTDASATNAAGRCRAASHAEPRPRTLIGHDQENWLCLSEALAQTPPTKKPEHPPKMKQARQARATIITTSPSALTSRTLSTSTVRLFTEGACRTSASPQSPGKNHQGLAEAKAQLTNSLFRDWPLSPYALPLTPRMIVVGRMRREQDQLSK